MKPVQTWFEDRAEDDHICLEFDEMNMLFSDAVAETEAFVRLARSMDIPLAVSIGEIQQMMRGLEAYHAYAVESTGPYDLSRMVQVLTRFCELSTRHGKSVYGLLQRIEEIDLN